jgi:hypothetical protein
MNRSGLMISLMIMVSSINIILPAQKLTADEEKTVKFWREWYERGAPPIAINLIDTHYIQTLEKENRRLEEQIKAEQGLFYGYAVPGVMKVVALGAGLMALTGLNVYAGDIYNAYKLWTTPDKTFVPGLISSNYEEYTNLRSQGKYMDAFKKRMSYLKTDPMSEKILKSGFVGSFISVGSLVWVGLSMYMINKYNNYQKKDAAIIKDAEERIALNQKVIEKLKQLHQQQVNQP